MGHHRKSRSTWRGISMPGARGAHHAQSTVPEPAPAPRSRSLAVGVSGRPLEELADAARTARRTGLPFLTEILASAETRAVPTRAALAPERRPRRSATHQPTTPMLALGRS